AMAFRERFTKLRRKTGKVLGLLLLRAIKGIVLAIVGLPFIMVHWICIHIYRGVVLGFEPRHEPYFSHSW
ncbi:hypothetical protein KC346_g431, partial [Hortaea werneckii]